MKESKYIIFESPVSGLQPIVFSLALTHGDIYSAIKTKWPGIEIVSAGFIDNKTKQCSGYSRMLGVGTNENDELLIQIAFGERDEEI